MALFDDVIAWLAAQGVEAYLVGGCVRDPLLGRPTYDLDVGVAGSGLLLARSLANHFQGAYYPLDEVRSTGRAILPVGGDEAGQSHLVVDIARLRDDVGGHPTLATDLAARDFTVNALAASVRSPDEIIDLHDGLADLQARIIRPVSESSIRRDPIRALRAVRLAATLGFSLAPETEALSRRDGPGLARVAGERIRDELVKLLALPHAAGFVAYLDDLGLLTVILPELEPLRHLTQPLPHHLPVLAHSLQVVCALEDILALLATPEALSSADSSFHDRGGDGSSAHYAERLASYVSCLEPYHLPLQAHFQATIGETRPRRVILKLAALLHDVAKSAAHTVDSDGRIRFIDHDRLGSQVAGSILRRLRFDATEIRLAETIVRHHMRPLLLAAQDGVSARAVYRLFRDTRDAGVDVAIHSLADHLATYRPGADEEALPRLVALVARLLGDFWRDGGQRVSPPRLIDGSDLLREFDLQPGPRIGELLEMVREGQVAGEIQTRRQALDLVRRQLTNPST